MESLRISESPRLDTLPTDILLIVLSYLDTARSIGRLASTSRGLNQLVLSSGWRIFVTTCFRSISLPPTNSEEAWKGLARSLTAQSRDWDRRAFVFHSLSPPEKRQPNGRRYHHPNLQSIPGNIIVDAHAWCRGGSEQELVVWGAGEDVIARLRQRHHSSTHGPQETWQSYKGSQSGYSAGKDDTTAISILRRPEYKDEGVLVGRANGDLQLLSTDGASFGHTVKRFSPSSTAERAIEQNEIQTLDFHSRRSMLAAGTKENVLLYSLDGQANHEESNAVHDGLDPTIEPTEAISLKTASGSAPFEFIRSMKFLNQETLAVALNRSFSPIQYLTMTPAGVEVSSSAKLADEYPSLKSHPRTVRSLLPIDIRSVAGGGGNALLSSWDDGTIRLQDLRTPSAVDRIYQDNFEVSTPINALVSHGLERFVAGSAYSHMLKIFDFRWSKGYYQSESLPCSNDRPYPTPKPPTIVAEPDFSDDRRHCHYVKGRPCRWHALSRHDFYRPNCNVYLPFKNYASSPIYSLAKSSDASPTIYAGLSGLLVEVTLKSGMGEAPPQSATAALYSRQRGKVAILETGDGSAITDISKCQRVPEIRRQSFSGDYTDNPMARRRHRLDEALQNSSELPIDEPNT
ncbi:Uu.00g124500.m01.CDS01 [Anthostomella pinea]|uniref:Uu.00g124500.m01.CDS01 n=1 Tax=Anthostomella pinea TaxID=933095 RepID=A0AAI8YHM0_9PEZI|nr:Uu.00g124500.m01.CDS01 [Anthostomella pinea]